MESKEQHALSHLQNLDPFSHGIGRQFGEVRGLAYWPWQAQGYSISGRLSHSVLDDSPVEENAKGLRVISACHTVAG